MAGCLSYAEGFPSFVTHPDGMSADQIPRGSGDSEFFYEASGFIEETDFDLVNSYAVDLKVQASLGHVIAFLPLSGQRFVVKPILSKLLRIPMIFLTPCTARSYDDEKQGIIGKWLESGCF